MHKDQCYRGGKQHKFSPRYSEQPNERLINVQARNANADEIRALHYYKLYICDICEWCGKRIDNSGAG